MSTNARHVSAPGNGEQNGQNNLPSQSEEFKTYFEERIADTRISCLSWEMLLDGDGDHLTVSQASVFARIDDTRVFTQTGTPDGFDALLFAVIKDLITSDEGADWLVASLVETGWPKSIATKMNNLGLVVAFIASRYRRDFDFGAVGLADLPILLRKSTTLFGEMDVYVNILTRELMRPNIAFATPSGSDRLGDAIHTVWAAVRAGVTPSPGVTASPRAYQSTPAVQPTEAVEAVQPAQPVQPVQPVKRSRGRPRKNTSAPASGKAKRGRTKKAPTSGPAAAAKRRATTPKSTDLADVVDVLMAIGSDEIIQPTAPPLVFAPVAEIAPELAVQLVHLLAAFWQTTSGHVVETMLNGDRAIASILSGLMRIEVGDVADVVTSVVLGYNGTSIRKRVSAAYK